MSEREQRSIQWMLELSADWRFKVGFCVGFGTGFWIVAAAIVLTCLGVR